MPGLMRDQDTRSVTPSIESTPSTDAYSERPLITATASDNCVMRLRK